MENETKNLLQKVLIWGGGALLVYIGIRLIWGMVGMVWGILNLPLWVPLLIGGGGYYAYRRLKGGRGKDKIEGNDRFKLNE